MPSGDLLERHSSWVYNGRQADVLTLSFQHKLQSYKQVKRSIGQIDQNKLLDRTNRLSRLVQF